jgi:hypothetical protein
MTDAQTLVDDYIAMWNERDPRRRRVLVARTVTENATYIDPLMEGDGVEQITAMIGAAQDQYPGHTFALQAGPDAHHDRVRFSWTLSPNGGEPIAVGVDFATVAGDGRMDAITGFLEPTAA